VLSKQQSFSFTHSQIHHLFDH